MPFSKSPFGGPGQIPEPFSATRLGTDELRSLMSEEIRMIGDNTTPVYFFDNCADLPSGRLTGADGTVAHRNLPPGLWVLEQLTYGVNASTEATVTTNVLLVQPLLPGSNGAIGLGTTLWAAPVGTAFGQIYEHHYSRQAPPPASTGPYGIATKICVGIVNFIAGGGNPVYLRIDGPSSSGVYLYNIRLLWRRLTPKAVDLAPGQLLT